MILENVLTFLLAVIVIFLLAITHPPAGEEYPEDINCPVCGYYCTGKGGIGCVHKQDMQ